MTSGKDVLFDHCELGMIFHGFQIIYRARGKIIDDCHGVTVCQKRFGQMTADKPGPAGDQKFHFGSFPLKIF